MKQEDRIKYEGPEFTCDISAKDVGEEMCMREFLRIHVPVAV